MRIAARLVLTLGIATAAVMMAYALITQRQREALLGDALVRETGALAHTLQIVTNNALRDRRFRDLNQVLRSVVEDPETFMATVADRQGTRLAGAVESDLACVPSGLPPLAARHAHTAAGRSAVGASTGWCCRCAPPRPRSCSRGAPR